MIERKIFQFLRIGALFLPAGYIASYFYHDLFLLSQDNKLSFLLWGFPMLHCVVVWMQSLSMATGFPYTRVREKSIVKIVPVPFCGFFPAQVRLQKVFYSIRLNNKTRIIDGVFVEDPNSILIYRNISDKPKILSIEIVAMKAMEIAANLIILVILKFLLL